MDADSNIWKFESSNHVFTTTNEKEEVNEKEEYLVQKQLNEQFYLDNRAG